MIEAARKYHELGFHVIPVGLDKRPKLPKGIHSWKPYQTNQTSEDIEKLFGKGEKGLAILTGVNGLEVIDVDQKYSLQGNLLEQFKETHSKFCKEVDFSSLVVVQTKSGGYHIMYRSDTIEGNLKLAERDTTEEEKNGNEKDRVRVLFETRGIGGYVLAYPTPGYEVIQGKFSSIPRISPDNRNRIISSARSFNQIIEQAVPVKKKSRHDQFSSTGNRDNSDSDNRVSVIEDYNERGDGVIDLLESAGWHINRKGGKKIYCRRPGSNAYSGNYHTEHGLFACFSTSTNFETGKGYNAFGVYAVLNHNGDFSAAAKDLYSKGFGDRMEKKESLVSPKSLPSKESKASMDELVAKMYEKKFDFNRPPEEGDYVLRLKQGLDWFDIGTFGMMILITGLAKSRKTTFLVAWIASALSGGRPFLNFHFDLRGKKAVWFDTEQPERYFYRTHSNIHKLSGNADNHPNYEAFSLRKFSVDERIELIDWYVANNPDLGLMILDGILDLVENFNDIKESSAVVEKVMKWCEEGIMVIPVIHRNRYSGFTMGNLGSKLEKKCDACIELENNEETKFSEIKCKLSRTRPFDPFDFTHNVDGYPVLDHNEVLDIDSPYEVIETIPVETVNEIKSGIDFNHVPSAERQNELSGNVESLVKVMDLEPQSNWGTVPRPKMNDDEDIPF